MSPESHFPIQNLPTGIFSTPGTAPRAGVAIGDFVVDLLVLHQAGAFNGLGFDSSVFGESTLNSFMEMDRAAWRAARGRVQQLLVEGEGSYVWFNINYVKIQFMCCGLLFFFCKMLMLFYVSSI